MLYSPSLEHSLISCFTNTNWLSVGPKVWRWEKFCNLESSQETAVLPFMWHYCFFLFAGTYCSLPALLYKLPGTVPWVQHIWAPCESSLSILVFTSRSSGLLSSGTLLCLSWQLIATYRSHVQGSSSPTRDFSLKRPVIILLRKWLYIVNLATVTYTGGSRMVPGSTFRPRGGSRVVNREIPVEPPVASEPLLAHV